MTRTVSLIPLVNMWCPQTAYPTMAIPIAERQMATYPKRGRREKTGMISLMIPMAGSTMM